jgi:bifunctional DNA-binding transcriptional regulator/antitoxin component of YhaV-PrlF toxin-antitoxin module
MNFITTVTSKGQVTIPELVRDMLAVNIGDKAYFEVANREKREMLVRLMPASTVDDLFGSLHKKGMKYVATDKIRKLAGEELGKKYQK